MSSIYRYNVGVRDLEGNHDRDKQELIIVVDGKIVATYEDNGEPEDNRFSRDWAWVADELQQAYRLGRQHMEDFLDKRLEKLRLLEGAGVDNWCGYSDAMSNR